jgi:hypothetical protein
MAIFAYSMKLLFNFAVCTIVLNFFFYTSTIVGLGLNLFKLKIFVPAPSGEFGFSLFLGVLK